ncbi:hypothetical protein [Haloglycomyces albus]|uniref:hypothetical protein n=1 Tax=Haloglycomyces albus TaxID=526067 RepID=UPI00046D48DB|nr:hypothetical protein [Haloglycomyces albus]
MALPSTPDTLTPAYHALPPSAWGLTLHQWLATKPAITDLPTPTITLHAPTLRHNITAMSSWCKEKGIEHAPHGKATMAPAVWKQQIDHGAPAITVANGPQAAIAYHAGIHNILIANDITDPAAIAWLSQLSEHGATISVFADHPDTVTHLDAHAHGPLDVYAELGTTGGRCGARDLTQLTATATAVHHSHHLRLVGVGGYEGSVTGQTDTAALAAIDTYLQQLATAHHTLDYDVPNPAITVGGSTYYDRIAALLADQHRVILRAGAYVVHDHGFYGHIAPAERGNDGPRLHPAVRGRARVISLPEANTAILDGGRRDYSFDQGLPQPLHLNAHTQSIADQHLIVTGDTTALAVGDTVDLAMSHPCTMFDKWRLIPVVDDTHVIDAYLTYF